MMTYSGTSVLDHNPFQNSVRKPKSFYPLQINGFEMGKFGFELRILFELRDKNFSNFSVELRFVRTASRSRTEVPLYIRVDFDYTKFCSLCALNWLLGSSQFL